MEFESIKKLIHNNVYQKTLSTITEEAGFIISSQEDSTTLNMGLEDIRASSLKEEDFYAILNNHSDLFTKFVLERLEAFRDIEDEEEYPEDEEPDEDDDDDDDDEDEDDEPTILSISPIGYMIEFHYLLAKDDKGLAQYLKKIRLPKASKHLEEVKEIFQSVQ